MPSAWSAYQNRGIELAGSDRMSKPLVPDELSNTIAPLLPAEPPKPKGGRPRAPDRACLVGVAFVLRSSMP